MFSTATGNAAFGLGLLACGLFVASPVLAGSDFVHASGPWVVYERSVPDEARGTVDAEYDAGGHSRFRLDVTHLAARTTYSGRVHLGGCPDAVHDVGPTFQLVPADPPDLARDPAFANDANEIWLDVSTDDRGAGSVMVRQPWQFSPAALPGSVILHEQVVPTRPGGTTAGPPLACLEVGF